MGAMTTQGYYRFPTIHRDRVVFVCEDDLWTVPASGGTARRLTSGLGEATTPFLSPDGRSIAFIGREEGQPEVYVMPADGGEAARRTFLGGTMSGIAGWSRDGGSILFWTNGEQPMLRMTGLFAVPRDGGGPVLQKYGRAARYISFGRKGTVLCRHVGDPARWKRYRGGRIGQLWVDRSEKGVFDRLIETGGNVSHPMWIGNRIYFHSDHEGHGNLYSCTPEGKDLRRHTDHEGFYLRNPSTDGSRIVYHAGADLHLFEPKKNRSRRIDVDFRSPRTQRRRKFVDAAGSLESYAPHPSGQSVAVTARGKLFSFANWEGAAVQHGPADGVRHRLACWLPDGKRLVAMTDEGGEDTLAVFSADGSAPARGLGKIDIGRAIDLAASPKNDQVVLSNHRYELVHVDLKSKRRRILDRSKFGRIAGLAWSPDGRWVAYSIAVTPHVAGLRLCEVGSGKTADATRPVLMDVAPAFDPEGKYLYFLSYREFDPVHDSLQFDLGFPKGMRPFLITLRKDLRSPFVPEPRRNEEKEEKKKKKPEKFRIDLDGIEDRAVAFPGPGGIYEQIRGIPGGVLFSTFPVEGSLGQPRLQVVPSSKSTIEIYRFADGKREPLVHGITDFELSADAKILFARSGDRLRALPADVKPDAAQEKEAPSRKSGWIDLDRVRISVDPGAEWRQMYDEAWRLMRDHFWNPGMSGVDWKKLGERYRPLVARVASRSEFSDLIWEIQGELGTSHCYELGGDYRAEPRYNVGLLAASMEYAPKKDAYRITGIVRGDPWNAEASSPLRAPGANLKVGDLVTAVNGRAAGKTVSPQELLVNLAGQEVTLTIAGGRRVTVKTLRSEVAARYRDWVNRNRDWVHRRSDGRVGYVHIPDMAAHGYSEFHRQYLAEVDRDGLIIDVRHNGGGNVSQLILQKLRRTRIGYDRSRWGQDEPYPGDSPAGPMVAVTNEDAGSDGDIFSHAWKLYGLGPLVGRRTWGGVIGIFPRHALVDGSVTTQPEFSFWFRDVGYGVENYGTDPDVDVDIPPHDHAAGRDPQLEKAMELMREALKTNPPAAPDLSGHPDLKPKRLPKR